VTEQSHRGDHRRLASVVRADKEVHSVKMNSERAQCAKGPKLYLG
jgi:hypothetical protein